MKISVRVESRLGDRVGLAARLMGHEREALAGLAEICGKTFDGATQQGSGQGVAVMPCRVQ
ncbi:hypothetical protein GCM10023333_41410 [Ferrimonas pelagia]|uniref:Uncharacterized protein n=1 Tax=Ferrimonas pelagia TaxID=1177826 RepID=A0ABP9FII8_9GAMM